MTNDPIYTIGHSTHDFDRFLRLLQRYEITAIADVRSMPYSKRQPHFNREPIKAALRSHGLAYTYLGEELGARSNDPECYKDGRVQYEKLAQTDSFVEGLERVSTLSEKRRVAMLCAEAEPLDCHRTILVSRELTMNGLPVSHILGDGRVESHDAAMGRLLRLFKMAEQDLFRTRIEMIDEACARQANRIAYVEPRLAGQPREEVYF